MTNNEKINISKSNFNFILSININKSEKTKSRINKQLVKLNINNLAILNEESEQYNDTYEEIQYEKSFLENKFCNNIHIDDIDSMFDKAEILLEMRLDNNTLVGYSLIDLEKKDSNIYIHLLCANSKYKKVGTAIINIIKEIGKQLDYNELQLHSVTDAVDFYVKLKFKCYKDVCLLEKIRKNKEKLITVDTDNLKEHIERGYECPDNRCFLVYKIKNMSGGKNKTLKKKRIF
jgi:hypothetical protein